MRPGAQGRGDRLRVCFSGLWRWSQIAQVNPRPSPFMCVPGPVSGTRQAAVDLQDADRSLDGQAYGPGRQGRRATKKSVGAAYPPDVWRTSSFEVTVTVVDLILTIDRSA